MTASKPEIVWIHPDAFTDEPAMYTTSRQKIGPGPEIQAIRLTDHESARAADKARIAELRGEQSCTAPGGGGGAGWL